MNKFIYDIVTKVACFAIPISGIMMLLTDNVISVLFQRGKFDAVSTVRTAKVFLWYLPGTFFMAAGLVVIRAYYSVKNTLLPLLLTTAAVLLCLPLFYFLNLKIGAKGIALSSSLFMFLSFTVLIVIWNLIYKNKFIFSFLKSLLFIIIFSVVGLGLCHIIKLSFIPYVSDISSSLLKNVLIIITAGIPSFILVVLLLEITGVLNLKEIIHELRSRKN